MKHKVSTLSGALLDAAVAKVEGIDTAAQDSGFRRHPVDVLAELAPEVDPSWLAKLRAVCDSTWSPSTDWRDGGPIIERELISVFPRLTNLFEPDDWASVMHVYPEPGQDRLPDGSRFRYIEQHAETPLIAAMRAYVASKFGDEVELP